MFEEIQCIAKVQEAYFQKVKKKKKTGKIHNIIPITTSSRENYY